MVIELCITTNWALQGPSFAEIRDKRGCGDENSTQEKKQGTKLVFSPKLVFRGVSSQVLDIPYQRLGYCPFPSINQALLNFHN
jgi:hypothetical protein